MGIVTREGRKKRGTTVLFISERPKPQFWVSAETETETETWAETETETETH